MVPNFSFKFDLRRSGRIVFAAVFILILTFGATAATLAEYYDRLDSARMTIEELFQAMDEGDRQIEKEIIAELEANIPVKEKVEWLGGTVEADNQWMRALLRMFADETDDVKRRAILVSISERLLSIAESVRELEESAQAEQTKDRDKQKLAEILSRVEYQKPQATEESLFQKWWREFLDWLAKVFPRPQFPTGEVSGIGSLQFGLQILVYILVAALVGFLIYKFAPFLLKRSRRKRARDNDDRVILGDRIDANSSGASIFAEAEALARNGDLRAAIRKGYIALLWELGNRKLVRLAGHKTNRDYLRDVRSDKGLSKNLAGLTGQFESSWYGLQGAEQSDWEDFRARYQETIAGVKR